MIRSACGCGAAAAAAAAGNNVMTPTRRSCTENDDRRCGGVERVLDGLQALHVIRHGRLSGWRTW